LGQAPEPVDPKDRVVFQLNAERSPRWKDLTDLAPTAVIRFHRSNWNQNGCLNPGLLGAMARRVKDQPRDLMVVYPARRDG
jgi:hypothetical protein